MSNLTTLFPINFSSSMLSDVQKCEMFFFRKHVQHLVSNLKNPDLIAGGLFAKACEITRKSFYNDGHLIDDAIEAGYNFILTGESTLSLDKSNERVALAFKKYLRRFPLDSNTIPCTLVDGTKAVEYYFLFDLGIPHPDLPDRNICFRGQLDMLVEKTIAGFGTKRYVLDEKTCNRVHRVDGTKIPDIPKEEDIYKSRGQFISYNYAARQLGVQTEGTIVRRVPVLKNEQLDAFEITIPCSDWLIEQWHVSTISKIEELVEKYKYYKANNCFPHQVFYPAYDELACNSFSRPCDVKIGCTVKEGEEILGTQHRQLYHDRENDNTFIPLRDFKKDLGL